MRKSFVVLSETSTQCTHWLFLLSTLFFVSILSQIALAQQSNDRYADSIKTKIRASKPDTSRARLLFRLGDYYVNLPNSRQKNIDSAKYYYNRLIQLSETIKSDRWKNEGLMGVGVALNRSFQRLEGRAYFEKVANFYGKRNDRQAEADTWNRCADSYPRDPESVLQKIFCYEKAALIYRATKDKLGELQAQKNIADMHLVQGKYDLSESELLKIINEMKEIGFKNLHYTYDLLAAVNSLKGDLRNELYYELQTVKSVEETKDYRAAKYYYDKLARTYHSIGMEDKSLYYYKKALPFALTEKNIDSYYDGLRIIAGMLSQQHKGTEALTFLTDSSRKYPPTTNNERKLLAMGYAASYENMGMYSKAESYYLDAVRLAKLDNPINDKGAYADCYYPLVKFYDKTGQFRAAKPYLRELLNTPRFFVKPVMLRDVELFQARVDSSSGNFAGAFKHFKAYHALDDSLFNASQKRIIEMVQLKSESERKDIELKLQSKNIALLKKGSQLEKSQLHQSVLIVNLLIWGSCLLLTLLIYGYTRYRQNQITNQKLKVTQQVLFDKNSALERSLEENDWLLKEVHHRVKNNMQMVISLLTSQCDCLTDQSAVRAITESRHRIQAMALIHQKLYQTNHASSIYMPEYVSELVDYLKESFEKGRTIYFNLDIAPIHLAVHQAIPVGLILNEAITNSIRHAFTNQGDGEITVKFLEVNEKEVMLLIKDNGSGFKNDEGNLTKRGSFGLLLIRGLTEDLGGTYILTNTNGTSISSIFKPSHDVRSTIANGLMFED